MSFLEMYRLYHYTLCPMSRAVRIAMMEKSVPFTAIVEQYWEKRDNFLRINKSGSVPFLAKKASNDQSQDPSNNQHVLLSGINAILEYLEDKFDNIPLIFGDPEQRAEIRKMCDWFNIKFYNEVLGYVLTEKVIAFFKTKDFPDTTILGIASQNLSAHLDYIGYLIGNNGWIASKKFSIADVVAAAHISVLDYLGMIGWQKMNDGSKANIRDWYSIIKSRPSFRTILQDSVGGFVPPAHYRELDF